MYFSLKIASLDSWISEANPALGFSEFDGPRARVVLFGQIYGSSPTLAEISERGISQVAAPWPGRFVLVRQDRQSGHIEVWTDKYRLLGAFFERRGGELLICNDEAKMTTDVSRLDLRAVADLLALGYVAPPLTLFSNVRQLEGYIAFDRTCEVIHRRDWREQWPECEEAAVSADEIYSVFEACARGIVDRWSPTIARVSGGVDARLVLSALDPQRRRRLRLEVVCAPHLTEDEDRDALGARQIADALDLDVKIVHLPAERSAYFAGLDSVALSGLFGGEFLGGVLFRPEITGIDGCGQVFSASEIADGGAAFEESHVRRQSEIAKLGTRRYLASIYLGSARSTIYSSIRRSWANPSLLHKVALSPFAEPGFLDAWLTIPDERLYEYGLYREIVSQHLFEPLKRVPFSSPIASSSSGLARFSTGEEPKGRTPRSEQYTRDFSESFRDLLGGRGIHWSPRWPRGSLGVRLKNLESALEI